MAKRSRVSRVDGSDNDVLVPRGEDEGFGLVVPKAISGLKDINMKDDVAGPAAGMLATILGTLVARKWGGKIHSAISSNAEIAGTALGVGAMIPVGMVLGKKVATKGIVSAILTGIALWGTPRLVAAFSGIFSGAGPYVPSMGLLTAQPVGYLPSMVETTDVPSAAGRAVDVASWGPTA